MMYYSMSQHPRLSLFMSIAGGVSWEEVFLGEQTALSPKLDPKP